MLEKVREKPARIADKESTDKEGRKEGRRSSAFLSCLSFLSFISLFVLSVLVCPFYPFLCFLSFFVFSILSCLFYPFLSFLSYFFAFCFFYFLLFCFFCQAKPKPPREQKRPLTGRSSPSSWRARGAWRSPSVPRP